MIIQIIIREREKRDKYLDLAKELTKTMKHESDCDTSCNRRTRYSHPRIGTRNGGLGNRRTGWDHPNYSIVEISQNTKKSPRDLRRLTAAQTPLENYQQTKMDVTVWLDFELTQRPQFSSLAITPWIIPTLVTECFGYYPIYIYIYIYIREMEVIQHYENIQMG